MFLTNHITRRTVWIARSRTISPPQTRVINLNTLTTLLLTGLGVKAAIEFIYVNALQVMATHMITIKIHTKNLCLRVKPLISSSMMLSEAMKLVVLMARRMVYDAGSLLAMIEDPALWGGVQTPLEEGG